MKLQRHMVQVDALERIYNAVEALIPVIVKEVYPQDTRRQSWAVDEINHVLRTIHKWANTIEAKNRI